MKYFRSITLLSVTVIAGCGEPTYEQCIRDAVKDGKSEYGTKRLTNLCDKAEVTQRKIADDKCFTELTKKFGAPAVDNYKYLLGGSIGRCNPSVDLPSWVAEAENDMETVTSAAANAAVARTEAAMADAVEEGPAE
jgi:hypothetical protein